MTSPKLTNLRNIHIISEMALNGTAEYQAFGSRSLRNGNPKPNGFRFPFFHIAQKNTILPNGIESTHKKNACETTILVVSHRSHYFGHVCAILHPQFRPDAIAHKRIRQRHTMVHPLWACQNMPIRRPHNNRSRRPAAPKKGIHPQTPITPRHSPCKCALWLIHY